ncbi:hypothetical protein C8R43DRAFT_954583 [Mycena crocata]|nr:hypothetical protein C8R43DRAFT_954583 [Mycena crocata]
MWSVGVCERKADQSQKRAKLKQMGIQRRCNGDYDGAQRLKWCRTTSGIFPQQKDWILIEYLVLCNGVQQEEQESIASWNRLIDSSRASFSHVPILCRKAYVFGSPPLKFEAKDSVDESSALKRTQPQNHPNTARGRNVISCIIFGLCWALIFPRGHGDYVFNLQIGFRKPWLNKDVFARIHPRNISRESNPKTTSIRLEGGMVRTFIPYGRSWHLSQDSRSTRARTIGWLTTEVHVDGTACALAQIKRKTFRTSSTEKDIECGSRAEGSAPAFHENMRSNVSQDSRSTRARAMIKEASVFLFFLGYHGRLGTTVRTAIVGLTARI